ncbi:MAG TPA: hypothetical protein VFV78_04770 [Vicinamibacterales bacterium]|nr:hypothetical protein [Vicinamibacterales bacterium]
MILAVAAWLVMTILHVALTARAIGRVGYGERATTDDAVFACAVGSVASLSLVLHLTAVTVGISLLSAIAGLALWHLAIAFDPAWIDQDDSGDGFRESIPGAVRATGPFTLPERVMTAILLAILLTWVGLSARSADVIGPDAAHYHVPYALNFATGASPFSLPATPHLYPMGASVVTAWFILPTGTPLLADLALALPFAVIIASINLIFRAATNRSGLAWGSWLGLALFATPMFRYLSQGSADLWFAAGFLALTAAIVRAWSRQRWHVLDLLLAGAAAGLLLGSKTTGAPATGLILATAALLSVARRVSGAPKIVWPRWTAVVLAGAGLVAIGAGGIWLVRNWIQFGSPLAPAGLTIAGVTVFPGETFQRSSYLSVLGEMQTDAFHLLPRARSFIDLWFGAWYLPALVPIVFLVADLIGQARHRNADPAWWPRVLLLAIGAGVGAALIWLLIGAPWTALDRSNGLTLRYVLPIAASLPLLAFIGCFPIGAPWDRRALYRRLFAVALALSVAILWGHAASVPNPGSSIVVTPAAHAWWVFAAAIGTIMIGGRPGRSLLTTGLILLGVVWWAPRIVRANQAAQINAEYTLGADLDALTRGSPPADAWKRAALAIFAIRENEADGDCSRRRYFALTRFDEPLALQPPGFGDQVFYAGRDVDSARRAGPMGPCDYVITSPALMETVKGQALLAALMGPAPAREWARTPDLVVLKSAAIR